MNKYDLEQQRLDNVNELIRVIGGCGRQFFRHKDRFAHMELDGRGRVWFIDDYSQKRIYTHHRNGRWSGFSHGGTLRKPAVPWDTRAKHRPLMVGRTTPCPPIISIKVPCYYPAFGRGLFPGQR